MTKIQIIDIILFYKTTKEIKMTTKYKLVIGVFIICFTAIGAGGFGWNWFLKTNACDHYSNDIKRLMDDQDHLLMTYGLFAKDSLTEDKQLSFQKIVDIKEPLIRASVENFKQNCQSDFREKELITFLKSYEIYTFTKERLFKQNEYHNNKWIREHYPYED